MRCPARGLTITGMENKYTVPLDALETSAHVPVEDQVEEHPEPPPPHFISQERVEQQKLIRILGDP